MQIKDISNQSVTHCWHKKCHIASSTSNVTWSHIIPHIEKCYFKHQILSKSNKNYKVFQNSQENGTHEVSGHFNIIRPSFALPTAEHELPVAVKPEILTHRTEHTVGLKMPLGGSTSNFKSFRHRLTQKGNSRSDVSSPVSDSVEDTKSSIRAYGWSQNTSKRLHIKF